MQSYDNEDDIVTVTYIPEPGCSYEFELAGEHKLKNNIKVCFFIILWSVFGILTWTMRTSKAGMWFTKC